MTRFSFFDDKEPPKLPVTPGSSFGSLANMPCFTFGTPKTATSTNDAKVFSFGCNPIKQTEANFDIKMEELRLSLSSITSQPLSVSLTKNKSISERAKKISRLENALVEIQSLKDKVSNVESNIAKLLMDELDSMKENVSGCINPFINNMQIVEQKSVSTSPTQQFEYQQPTLFSFGSLTDPMTKSKPKLLPNFKPQTVNMPLVFNGTSISLSSSTVSTTVSGITVTAPVSGSAATDPITVSTFVAPFSAGTISAPTTGSGVQTPANSSSAYNLGVAPPGLVSSTNETTLSENELEDYEISYNGYLH